VRQKSRVPNITDFDALPISGSGGVVVIAAVFLEDI
jgi:hypothetical protein